VLKEYTQILLKNSDQLDLEKCTSVFYFFFRLGISVDDEGPSIHKQSAGGFNNLINSLNKRLITIFDQLARKPDPKEAIVAMQEILKTPSKALKQLML